jgi:arabinose-5-phosphate isomerase
MSSDIRQFAEHVIHAEVCALRGLIPALDEHFDRAVRLVLDCPGAVLTCGIGKAGHVARKLSASFSSTGTPSHFLNPAEAMHGDLGSVRKGDVVVILSYSGESDEILRVLSVLKKLGHPVIAMTSTAGNALGRHADVVLKLGKVEEACPLGLAPSASTTAMLALGDALFLTVMKWRNFTSDDFAIYHPAGQLGRKLIRVKEAMTFKLGENLPVARDSLTVREVLHDVSSLKRRSGAVVLVDDIGRVSGIFTDGDLRRTLTDDDGRGAALGRPIGDVMTRNPKRIRGDQLASEAIAMMRPARIDELPVVDDHDRPIGLIDIQDLVVLRMLDVDGKAEG